MKKIWNWLKESNRIQHFGLGAVYGFFASGLYCALYGGIGVAGALEFKDYKWGGKPDWVDFLLTLAGVLSGYGIGRLVLLIAGYE